MSRLSQSRVSFGLDYSDGKVATALFTMRQRHIKLVGLNSRMLQTPQQLDQSPTELDALRQAIRSATSKERDLHYPKHAVVTLPDASCYLLTVDLPERQAHDTDTIRSEASQHLPFALDDLVLDSSIAGTENGVTTVQIAACPVVVVDTVLAALDGTGLEAVKLMPAGIAALRAFAVPPTARSAVVVLVNDTATTVMLLTNRGIPFTVSTEALQRNRVLAILSKSLRLSDLEAGEATAVCGLDPAVSHGIVRKVLENEVAKLLGAIRSVVSFALSFTVEGAPSALLLGGSGALLRHLDRELQDRSKLDVLLLPLLPELARALQDLKHPPQTMSTTLAALGAGLPRL